MIKENKLELKKAWLNNKRWFLSEYPLGVTRVMFSIANTMSKRSYWNDIVHYSLFIIHLGLFTHWSTLFMRWLFAQASEEIRPSKLNFSRALIKRLKNKNWKSKRCQNLGTKVWRHNFTTGAHEGYLGHMGTSFSPPWVSFFFHHPCL